MYKLIIDSGGTKTAWVLATAHQDIAQGQVEGMNPYMLGENELCRALQTLSAQLPSELFVSEVFFYGAGCRAAQMSKLMGNWLAQQFPNSTIQVFDDLTATARALLGNKSGVAAILGTGSSTGYYQSGNIRKYAPSNGVWLGDEGSGAYLGKELIRAYLNSELPISLHSRFEKSFPDRREKILEQVYRSKKPNAYLGGFVPWLKSNISDQWVEGFLIQCFTIFFKRLSQHLGAYQEEPLAISGGVAQHFKPLIQKVGQDQGWSVDKVNGEVLSGLKQFHKKS